MPLDSHAMRVLDMIAATRPKPPTQLSLAERRKAFSALMNLAPVNAAVAGVETVFMSRPLDRLALRVYTPTVQTLADWPAVIFFHGGGMVAGSLDSHDWLCRCLAAGAEVKLVSVDYRLGPEHPFPAAIADAGEVTAWVFAHAASLSIDRQRIGVAGDSAGGTLAASVCQWASGVDRPPIAFMLLICPVLDFSVERPSRREFAAGYLLDRVTLEHDFTLYAPTDVDRADPRISPLRATDLTGTPPTAIHTAEFDPVRDEGNAYAERLAQAGVPVQHACHAGMIHHFYAMPGLIPHARTALAQISDEIRAGLTAA